MRKILLLLTIVLVVFLAVNRERIFLWDPIASVTRDGAKVPDIKVLINFSNDVLIEDRSTGRLRIALVQNWNQVAEYPTSPLRCIGSMACMTDADHATASPLPVGARGRRTPFRGVTMTDRRVEFVDQDGALVAVTIR